MLTNRIKDFFGEVAAKKFSAELFMAGINAAKSDVFTEIVEHVSEVMEQTGEHHGVGFIELTGKFRCLQRMLLLADILTVVSCSAFSKDREDLLHRIIGLAG
jgi:hypothetical protein